MKAFIYCTGQFYKTAGLCFDLASQVIQQTEVSKLCSEFARWTGVVLS